MATNNKASLPLEKEVKKPFIKNNRLMGIIIGLGVVVAIVVFVINVLGSKESNTSSNAAKTEVTKIRDYVTSMVSNGTVGIKYVDSTQRKKLMIACPDCYYSIQHNGNNLYFWQGTYTQAATTDEMKFAEAIADSNVKIFSEYVTDFAVENYNQGNDTFSDGKVKLRIRVEKDGKSDCVNFDIPLPETK